MQLILYFISTALYAPMFVYALATQNVTKSFDRQISERFVNGISVTLIYLYPGLSFFAFTLSSKTFRKEFMKLFPAYRLQRVHVQAFTVTHRTQGITTRHIPTF